MNRPCKILVVDDEPTVLLFITHVLEAAGYAVQGATTGKHALEAVRRERPDIVLLDVLLPDTDGLAVCREIKADAASREIYVVLASGLQRSSEQQADGLEAGADDFIAKPLLPRELLARVRAIERIKSAENALRASEKRYRNLVEFSPLPVIVHCEEKIVFLNPAAIKALGGQSAADFLGKSIWDMVHGDARAAARERVEAVYAGRHSVLPSLEERFVRLDGGVMDVEVMAAEVDYMGKPASQVVFTDITERKRAERALKELHKELEDKVAARTAELRQANLRLEELAQLKDEFLACMSHELRSPLNAILGSAEMLEEQIYGPLNDKQIKSLQLVRGSGEHLLSLINDILDVAKIEAGKFELVLGPVFPEEICEGCLSLIREAALKKHLRVASRFDSAVGLIQADARRLKQILINLLSNAVKFTPPGGTVGLEFSGDAEQEVLRFTVWDSGIGIPESALDKLFQPFVQLDSQLGRGYQGTGLGLVLVKNLVDLHGGSVSLESGADQGARFTVSLPWRRGAATGAPPARALPPPEAAPAEGGAHVLVADDNADTRALLGDYLQANGYRISLAEDGPQAVARALAEHPDALLVDVQMPGMDGLAVIRRLRQALGTRGFPVIALTALAMPGDKERCLAAGADSYLSKPVALKQLRGILRDLLARPPAAT